MKYLLLLVILIASTAWAGWTKVNSSNGTDFYIDVSSVKAEGAKRTTWQLTNYSTPQSLVDDYYLSSRARVEFDCKEEKSRLLTITVFSMRNADGKPLLTSDEPTKWSDIAPYTTARGILNAVCKLTAR
jgi:hypothetical protein